MSPEEEPEECKHGIAEATCSWCSPSTTTFPRGERGPVIQARFDGRCPGCTRTIHEGDPICLIDDEWLCEECW